MKKGDRVSEYILEEPLGRGGFGEVWRARHHLWHDREVAVKIPIRPEAVRDLSNEGVIQASLEHPGIAKSLGMDTNADPPYFVVELIDGESLRKILQERGKLPPEEVRSILDQILSVLEYAHGRGVIHQDIKPENILLTESGDVKLTDFGLGQNVHGESILLSMSLRTEGAGPGGTIGYIAPEIRDQEGPPDGRADLYSVGIMLFELLTGRRPAGGEVPSELEPGLPEWCDRVFRGLYTRRESRFPDVVAVRAALENEPVTEAAAATASPPPIPIVTATSGPQVRPLVPPAPDLVPGDEACVILGVTADRLRAMVGSGELAPVSVNGKLHYDRNSLGDAREAMGLPRTRSGPPPVPSQALDDKFKFGTRVDTNARAKKIRPKRGAAQPVSAGLFVRGLAAGIDLWCVFWFSALVGSFFFRGGPSLAFSTAFWFLLYSWISLAGSGRTLGKLVLGIRVTTPTGTDVSPGRGLLRCFGLLLSVFTFGAGFFIIPFNPRKQGLHDYLADTIVVYDRK